MLEEVIFSNMRKSVYHRELCAPHRLGTIPQAMADLGSHGLGRSCKSSMDNARQRIFDARLRISDARLGISIARLRVSDARLRVPILLHFHAFTVDK